MRRPLHSHFTSEQADKRPAGGRPLLSRAFDHFLPLVLFIKTPFLNVSVIRCFLHWQVFKVPPAPNEFTLSFLNHLPAAAQQ